MGAAHPLLEVAAQLVGHGPGHRLLVLEPLELAQRDASDVVVGDGDVAR